MKNMLVDLDELNYEGSFGSFRNPFENSTYYYYFARGLKKKTAFPEITLNFFGLRQGTLLP